MTVPLRAPFPYFGGKRDVAPEIWKRLGAVKQYIEPFCGSAAVLLGAPKPASLEVVNDFNGFIANFWRAVKNQASEVAFWADYPVSHIDLGARHIWLLDARESIALGLQDPNWPGDAQAAGWWLWGQCCWIGSGWCEWTRPDSHASDAGRGIQALGQIPHAGNAGMGIQALGKIPHASDAGRGELMTSGGRVALEWLSKLAARLERVRVTHGDWSRCLNNHYGAESTAVFIDPPYRAFEKLYRCEGVADAVEKWAQENASIRIALCGHIGDYPSLSSWDAVPWTRKRLTYSGAGTTDKECIWFSPACLRPRTTKQIDLFSQEDSA
jgi:DNA adenine methylase